MTELRQEKTKEVTHKLAKNILFKLHFFIILYLGDICYFIGFKKYIFIMASRKHFSKSIQSTVTDWINGKIMNYLLPKPTYR